MPKMNKVRIALSIAVAIGLVYATSIVRGTRTFAAENTRLRVHAVLSMPSNFASTQLIAVCDTGNGTLIYTFSTASNSGGTAVALVPAGCRKESPIF